MLVIIYSKLLILAVRQKDTKSYRPPLPSKPDILILSRGSTRWGESVFGSMVTVVPVSTIDSYSSLSNTALLNAEAWAGIAVQTLQMPNNHLS